MKKFIVEHWREDELLEAFDTNDVTISIRSGTIMVIKFMPGLIELATDDELHLNLSCLTEFLNEYTRTKKK